MYKIVVVVVAAAAAVVVVLAVHRSVVVVVVVVAAWVRTVASAFALIMVHRVVVKNSSCHYQHYYYMDQKSSLLLHHRLQYSFVLAAPAHLLLLAVNSVSLELRHVSMSPMLRADPAQVASPLPRAVTLRLCDYLLSKFLHERVQLLLRGLVFVSFHDLVDHCDRGWGEKEKGLGSEGELFCVHF